jgi:hypothetical protein
MLITGGESMSLEHPLTEVSGVVMQILGEAPQNPDGILEPVPARYLGNEPGLRRQRFLLDDSARPGSPVPGSRRRAGTPAGRSGRSYSNR